MGKFNLSEAAQAILNEDPKAAFAANVKEKQGARGQDKHPKGEVGKDALPASTAYGTKDAGIVGQSIEKNEIGRAHV